MCSKPKKIRSSSSPTLSDDLIISIFLILPPQALLRCQSVCKTWYAIIDSAYFIDLHLNRPENKDYLLTYPKNSTSMTLFSYLNKTSMMITTKPYPWYPITQQQWKIVGCVRGILCFFTSKIISFWNPYTRKSKTIPNPSNPSTSNQSFGFEFVASPPPGDFKLVRLVSESHNNHLLADMSPDDRFKITTYEVDVYTPSSDSWKRIEHSLPNCTISSARSEVTVNGNVHWKASSTTHNKRVNNFILGFDMTKEVFIEISLPECCHGEVEYVFVNSCDEDYLVLCVQYPYMNFSIWVMEDYGVSSSWIKLFKLDTKLLLVTPFKFGNNYEELVAVNLAGSLIVYDCTGREVIRYVKLFDGDKLVHPALTYRESLVWVEKSNVMKKKGTEEEVWWRKGNRLV